MLSPHRLHATAAAWSLTDARRRLAQLAADEAAQIAAEALEAPSVLRSTVYGAGHGSGSHSDPTPAMVAAADRPARRNRWAEMVARLDGKLGWLAEQIDAPGAGLGLDPLALVMTALPTLQPGTARVVAKHLADEEQWVRDAIGQPRPAERILPGDPECPACRGRELRVQTAGPREAWTVVCVGRWEDGRHDPCLCVGQGCRCGMPGAVEGVAHIWPRDAVLRAVAGAAPTQPAN